MPEVVIHEASSQGPVEDDDDDLVAVSVADDDERLEDGATPAAHSIAKVGTIAGDQQAEVYHFESISKAPREWH